MDRSVTKFAGSTRWTTDDIRSTVEGSEIVVFARGDEEHPKCGYSKQVFDVMHDCGKAFEVVDVKKEPSAAAALRAYEGRVKVPAVYVGGRLVSTSDNVTSSIDSSELRKQVQVRKTP